MRSICFTEFELFHIVVREACLPPRACLLLMMSNTSAGLAVLKPLRSQQPTTVTLMNLEEERGSFNHEQCDCNLAMWSGADLPGSLLSCRKISHEYQT
jgi:hypothetical protein